MEIYIENVFIIYNEEKAILKKTKSHGLRVGIWTTAILFACLFYVQPAKVKAAEYGNTYYCINQMLKNFGTGNYVCTEDKTKKELTIKLLNNVTVSDNISIDGADDFSSLSKDWIPLDEMSVIMDFNGYYVDLVNNNGISLSDDAHVTFVNSGGIRTSGGTTSMVFVSGSTLKIKKSDSPAKGEEGKTPGVPSFIDSYSDGCCNTLQISNYSDGEKTQKSDVDIENAYITSTDGIGIIFRGGNLDIQYATITAKRSAVENGSTTSDNRLCIYDGVYKATDMDPKYYSAAVTGVASDYDGQLEPVYGYIYLYGGSYSGYSAMYLSSARAYISGPCKLEGLNAEGILMYDSSLVVGNAQTEIVSDEWCTIWASNSDIAIAGGKITGKQRDALYGKNCDIKIKSGEFTSDVECPFEMNGGTLAFMESRINGDKVTEKDVTSSNRISLDKNVTVLPVNRTDGEYHITYVNAEGYFGYEFNPTTVKAGETYQLQDLYTPEAYFGGWFTDEACTQEITELSNVTSDMTLYFKFLDQDKNEKKQTVLSYSENIVKDCTELTPFDLGVTIQTGNKDAKITYKIQDNGIATVTSDGKIQLTGKEGTDCVCGHVEGNDQYLSKDFSINLDVRKRLVKISCPAPKSPVIVQGGSVLLNAKVTDTNGAAPGKLIYISSDSSIISVDEKGNMTAYKKGTVNIRISMQQTDQCRADDIIVAVQAEEKAKADSNNSVTHNKGLNKNAYTITYVLNKGVNNKKNPSSYTTATNTIVLKSATRKGYKFVGWYRDKTFNQPVNTIQKGSTENVTLYAKWKKITYKITYKLNKGKNNKKNPKKYTVTSKTIKLKAAKRKGYKFVGWYRDKKCKHAVKRIKKGSTGKKIFYAKWKKR